MQVIEVEHDKFAYRIYFQALPVQKGSASFSAYTVEVHATTGQSIGFQKNSAKKGQTITKQNQPLRDAFTATACQARKRIIKS
ncbi:hypothetical protein [Brevibacillus reuszeri]|uniref:hypothetical protein n=1 Tax=Brevibacillus reuszeri TaxID=54915 RepID=UPI00289BCA34|nr:hypothetical protein [Brevibacillus reuszeri]